MEETIGEQEFGKLNIESNQLQYNLNLTTLSNKFNQLKSYSPLINVNRIMAMKEALKDLSPLLELPIDLEDLNASFPLFFKRADLIKIPSKVEEILTRHIPLAELLKIDPDKQTAIELCLMFTTRLTTPMFIDNSNGWVALQAKFLDDDFEGNNIYRRIVDVLLFETKKGAIINKDEYYIPGCKSFNYRLTDTYRLKGVKDYILKSDTAKKLLNKQYYKAISRSMKNIICQNLCNLYGQIELPTHAEIISEAKRLIKQDFYTKKGKKLTFLNKHKRDYYKNPEELSFVEQSIKLFDFLTSNGFMIPQPTGAHNGGRVVDSFTLMPSWIRNLVKINGKKIVEADFSGLHPNIAATLYSGKTKFITHGQVSQETGLDIKSIKIEHLSFFNKTPQDMTRSPLFNYYLNKETDMIIDLIADKNKNGHKITSKKMFTKEVEIMTMAIEKLNKEQIYVGYVYDAIFCEPAYKNRVIEVMNESALAHGVFTTAK